MRYLIIIISVFLSLSFFTPPSGSNTTVKGKPKSFRKGGKIKRKFNQSSKKGVSKTNFNKAAKKNGFNKRFNKASKKSYVKSRFNKTTNRNKNALNKKSKFNKISKKGYTKSRFNRYAKNRNKKNNYKKTSRQLTNKRLIRKNIKLTNKFNIASRRGLLSKTFNTKSAPVRANSFRINLANGKTRFTPKNNKGKQINAGWNYVSSQHFNRKLANNRSVFTLPQKQIKDILQSNRVIKAKITAQKGGQFVRIVDTRKIIGNTSLNKGGKSTSWIKVITDSRGNLISTYPVAKP